MAGFERVWPSVAAIEGWLSREQAAALYAAAATVSAGSWIVEIGSHRGRSTVALANGKPASVRLLAVDPFPESWGAGESDYQAFLGNIEAAGVEGVHLIRETSQVAADALPLAAEAVAGVEGEVRPPAAAGAALVDKFDVGLLFVDGLHDRDAVLADIDAWEQHVAEGGLVYFHDAFFRLGVTLALLERHLLSSSFRYLGAVGNLAMFRREQVGARESLRGAVRLSARLAYFLRNAVVTIGVRRRWRWLQRLFPPEEDFEY